MNVSRYRESSSRGRSCRKAVSVLGGGRPAFTRSNRPAAGRSSAGRRSNCSRLMPNGRRSCSPVTLFVSCLHKMSIIVKKEGILSTIQDLGRVGYRRFGINPGGVMDRTSARAINCLLGNDPNAAVIELHFPAGSFEFERGCNFAIGGADFGAMLEGRAIAANTVSAASAGSRLSFERRAAGGNRAYLAVGGGFDAARWLGSASTNLRAAIGGHGGKRLQTGDRIGFADRTVLNTSSGITIGPSLVRSYASPATVRVTAGPEFEVLTALSEQNLFETTFE